MRVFATTAMQDPGVSTYKPVFAQLAAIDRYGAHELCEDPEKADFILFLDGHQHYRDLELRAIREHPLAQEYREKTFVYSEVDQPWCAMQGLYVAMPKSGFDLRRQRACSYLTVPNAHVAAIPLPAEPDGEAGLEPLLFSFMGRGGNRTRSELLRIDHPRAVIADTSATNFFGNQTAEVEVQKRRYAEVMARSKFVLCPRGAGTSSFRIFETMSAGRVPVIFSDAWVPPHGPDWTACSITIPEKDASRAGAILERHEERFPEMAASALREWQDWFAPDVLFHRMTESMASIASARTIPEYVLSRRITGRYIHMRIRAAKAQLRERISLLKRRALPTAHPSGMLRS